MGVQSTYRRMPEYFATPLAVLAAFIAVVSILVNLHHRTSWRVSTLAFAFCIVSIRVMGPFDIQFAPFVLGIGSVAWLAGCWFLRRKGVAHAGST